MTSMLTPTRYAQMQELTKGRTHKDWANAQMGYCGCGEWRSLIEDTCSSCWDANYAGDLRSALTEALTYLLPYTPKATLDLPGTTTARVEVEMNLGWAENNPVLFTGSVKEFYETYSATEWNLSTYSDRKGFLTLIAERRK